MDDLLELAIRDAVIAIFEEEIPLNDPFEAGDLVIGWIKDYIENWDGEEQEDKLRVETRIIKKYMKKILSLPMSVRTLLKCFQNLRGKVFSGHT